MVTVLFADLVGFTSRSEQLDPEEVHAFLSPYYARLRIELERFGGTVEKFIGDAVMAVFGAPVAHEDDPERAVRAALAIRDWVVEHGEGLRLRIAVNTGEVLVALDARPSRGEGMVSGDVVNTTSRLQTAAPVNGILVGEITHRATSHVISYRGADPVVAKGKTEPVPAWEVLEARSRFGVDLASTGRSPLVGRTHELGVLTDALVRVRRDRSPELVTLLGAPGIGKSRLVAELFKAIDEDPENLVLWRQGRSLPYGDGVTFWALGEMVKAQAGIMESDSRHQAAEKLHTSVSQLIPDQSDAQWVEGHLRPLAGLARGETAGNDRRDEAFAAWLRYFEGLTDRNPLVLVFEDLHWADENLLDFTEHLIDSASGVPMLILCTARPELLERRPGRGGARGNTTRLSLSPLTDDETAQLIGGLSDRPVMVAETQQALLARAGGNPLYAEQYVRMLAEQGDAEDLPMPETVQGIIAARLDALPVEEKSLLQAAAVMGKVFWLGAVAQTGGLDRRAAEVLLYALERKDFVQRARRSSVDGEVEYGFRHVLVPDVAYGQIPRRRRAEQHGIAAEWIGSLGRTADHAEMLAHHYLCALELRRATSQPVDPALAERALASLSEAGDRALSLNAFAGATGFYRSAMDLAPAGSRERAQLRFKLGRTQVIGGVVDADLLNAACAELFAVGDLETAAEAEVVLSKVHWHGGNTHESADHLGRARKLVEGRDPSRAIASLISDISFALTLTGDGGEEAIRLGRESLAMAEQLGLDELCAEALNNIGVARIESGDPGGIEDLERSLAIAVESNAPLAIVRAGSNLAGSLLNFGEVERALAMQQEGVALASRFGLTRWLRWVRGERPELHYLLGRWDEALAGADEFLAEVEAGAAHYLTVQVYAIRALVRLGRDDVPGALADTEHALELGGLNNDAQAVFPMLARCAHILREVGETERASALADEIVADAKPGRHLAGVRAVHVLAWTLAVLGRARELIDVLPGSDVPWEQAAAAFAAGDLRRAADVCCGMGAATEEARDRLWLAEALTRQGRRAEAGAELGRALAFYRSVGSTRYIREAEGLLAASA